MGAKGEKGDIGPQGIAGVAGPKGDKGEAGPQGIAGIAGPKGDTGLQGLTGPAGPKGDAGPIGPQGIAGVVGPRGDKGDKGDAGPQGIEGARGPRGESGERGAAGPQGIAGPEGPRGPRGESGEPGPAGTTNIADLKGTVPSCDGTARPICIEGASLRVGNLVFRSTPIAAVKEIANEMHHSGILGGDINVWHDVGMIDITNKAVKKVHAVATNKDGEEISDESQLKVRLVGQRLQALHINTDLNGAKVEFRIEYEDGPGNISRR